MGGKSSVQKWFDSYPMRVALVVLSSIVALLLTILFDDPLTKPNFFLIFLIAVVFNAWYGRLWSGILATFIISLGAVYFYLPPTKTFFVRDPNDVERLIEFIATSLLINFLIEALRSTRRQADEAEALYKNAASRMVKLFYREKLDKND